MELKSNVPPGPIDQKWTRHKFDMKLVNPSNKRKYSVIVVGSGLAGGSAAATLAELGYQVSCFCYQDTPRRAHSIAAQGGINAAKNYQNDGDSVFRLFYDTIKGGDYRARESNVHRLAEVSVNIIDQCAAQGVPFAREYGGLLANRSFGGAQVSRTFYARGQTGQQLLLGAYSALSRMVGQGAVEGILARWNSPRPAWLAKALEQTQVPRRTGIIYLNLKALRDKLLPLAPSQKDAVAALELLGLYNVDSLVSTTGLEDYGMINRLLLALDGKPRGLLDMVADRPLAAKDLAPIPIARSRSCWRPTRRPGRPETPMRGRRSQN